MSLRGFRASTAAALSVLIALTVVSWPSSTTAPASAAGGSMVKVGTYNIRAGVSTGTFRSAVRALRSRVDVAGLQEVNSKDKEAVLRSLSGWSYFRADRRRGEQNPVIWNSGKFAKRSARTVRTSGACHVGRERRGVNKVKPHYASVVRLRHRHTGKRIVVVNTHLIPGAVRGGRPVADRPRTVRCFKRELRNLRALIVAERRNGKVFAMGDFNAGFVADRRHRKRPLPFRRFKAVDMRSMWATERPGSRGTHNDALIDQIWSEQRASSASVAFSMNHSDHRPGIAGYWFAR